MIEWTRVQGIHVTTAYRWYWEGMLSFWRGRSAG